MAPPTAGSASAAPVCQLARSPATETWKAPRTAKSRCRPRIMANESAWWKYAPPVGTVRLDQRVVGVDRILEDVVAIVDAPRLLPFGELGAVSRRREERADAGASGTDALGERALRYELELDFAAAISLVEVP